MFVFELNKKENGDEADFPLLSCQAKIHLAIDCGDVVVPPRAARRLALQWLRRMVDEASEEDFLNLASSDADLHSADRESPSPRQNGWVQPVELDLRVVKSAHRIVLEVAKRGEAGRPVLASELVGSVGLSAPTVGRLLREGDAGHRYLAQYVRVTPDGRTKALDLTPEGRILASRIRAGVVPA